ncbi:MAG TPA: hypothetical protein VK077_10385 [Virgibacillus sp.]|nr:hypothetical protein [Virgibacillus sp.]
MLKKIGIFLATFLIVSVGFQIGSGILLTSFYVPKNPWNDVLSLSSEVTISSPTVNVFTIAALVLALLIAYGVMKVFSRRFNR